MKHIFSKLLAVAFIILVSVATCTTSYAQEADIVEYKVGDIITFKDGSQGIVCYVNPNDASRGWAAALTDQGKSRMDDVLSYLSELNAEPTTVSTWNYIIKNSVGKANTAIMRAHGNQAAMDADFFNGWYIPDINQLRSIVCCLSFPAFQPYKGHFGAENYWSSSQYSSSALYCLITTLAQTSWDGIRYPYSPTDEFYVRLVHDFGNEVEAGWVDNDIKPTMTVAPSVTDTYGAVVVYGKDTFNIPGTVVVKPAATLEITEPTDALCVGSDLELTATYQPQSTPDYIYTWGGDALLLKTTEKISDTVSTTNTRLNTPGTYKFYASVVDKNGYCGASDTVEVRVKPFGTKPVATGDEICPYDVATVSGQNTSATTTQYYRWYDSNKELVKADTLAAGVQTSYTTPPVTEETTYYLAVNDENSCAWDPKFMDVCGTIDYSSVVATDTFLLNASKNFGTTTLTSNDHIAFYDEGGKNGNVSTYTSVGWRHTFTAPTGKQVKLKINSFKTNSSGYGRLYVYDGTSATGTAILDLSGTAEDTTVISSTGSLTVKWTHTVNGSTSGDIGFEGEISAVDPVCYAAEAPVTFTNSPYVSLVSSVTDDEVCYDGTAELAATSDLDFPQYFTWWNSDYSQILKQDTLWTAGHSSISLPNQTVNAVYHVTVSNADNCAFAPSLDITSMADAHVTVKTAGDVEITLDDYEFCSNATDEVLTASFTNVSDPYGVIWVVGGDTVAEHLNIPNTQLTDTIHYTAPSIALCGESVEYKVVYLCDNGCDTVSETKHIIFNDDENPVVTGTLADINVTGCDASVVPAPATSVAELTGITVTDNCATDFTLTSNDSEPTGDCAKTIVRRYTIADGCGNETAVSQNIIVTPGSTMTGVPANDGREVSNVSQAVAPGAPNAQDACGTTIVPSYNSATDSIAHILLDGSGTIEHHYHYINCLGVDSEYVYTYTIILNNPLVIKSNDCELTYNGTEQTCEDYTVTYGGEEIPECTTCGAGTGEHKYVITPGDTITITDPATRRDVTDSVPNTFTVDIPNPEHFSDIDTVIGKIEVGPLVLVITTDDSTKAYDGTPLTDHGWLDTPPAGLVAGDTVVYVDIYGTITEPGDSLNRTHQIAIVVRTTDPTDTVTSNYIINYVEGTLTVTPSDKPLVIKSNDCVLTYNGTEQTCEDYTVTYGGEEIPECTTCGAGENEHKYVVTPGDTITITDPATRRDVTDSVPNTFTVDIPNPEHFSDIDTVIGKIVVDPLVLVITTDDSTKAYDGTPLTDHGWLDTPPAGLVAGDTVVYVDIYGTITEPGDSLNRTHQIAIVVRTTDPTDTVTSNYVITYVEGTLTVTPSDKPLVIKSNDCVLTYNGTEQSCEDYTVTYGGETIPECTTCGSTPGEHKYVVTPGDTITITDPATRRDVTDSVPNTFTVDIPNPEHFSDIDTVIGKIVVDPLVLVITTDDSTKAYDGTPLTDHGWLDTPPTGLATGDTVVYVDIYGTITEPGDSVNRTHGNAVVVRTGDPTDTVTSNYIINYVEGTLTVIDAFDATLASQADVTCKDAADGSAEITVTGGLAGDPRYTYTVDGGAASTTNGTISLTGLAGGSHRVIVADLADKRDTVDFTINEPDALSAEITLPADRCPNQGSYAVSVTTTGGNGTYHFVWSGDAADVDADATTVAQTLTNDCGNSYSVEVTVTDVKGCTVTVDSILKVVDTIKPTFKAPKDTTICRASDGTISAPTTTTGEPADVTDNCDAAPTVSWTDLDTTGTDLEIRIIHRQWTVSDACGNDSVKVQNISILPSVVVPGAIELTCAPDTTLELCYGIADTLLHLTAPTVVSHTGATYTVTSDPADGYRFPVGTTTVIWYITDDNDCGNSVTCTQNVTVTLPSCGTPADSARIDGYAYSSVRIGYQCWTGENMRHTHYADHSAVDADGYAVYNNDPANDEKFGKLYSWYAAMGLAEGDDATAVPEHTQGICPEGWAIPTVEDYLTMISTSGGVEYTRSPDTQYWLPSHTGTVPDSGVSFLARGAGYWDSVTETFNMLLVNTNFWTNESASGSSSAVSVEFGGICNSENYVERLKDWKVSVRCIKLCE